MSEESGGSGVGASEKSFEVEKKQKEKFEKDIITAIRAKNPKDNIIIVNNVTLKIEPKGKKRYSVFFGKDKLCSVDLKKEKFDYDFKKLNEYEQRAPNKSGVPNTIDIMKKLGFPNLKYLRQLEKQKKEKIQKKGELKPLKKEEEKNEVKKEREKEEEKKSKTGEERLKEKGASVYSINLYKNKVAGGNTLAKTTGLDEYEELFAVRIGGRWFLIAEDKDKNKLVPVGKRIGSHKQAHEIKGKDDTLEASQIDWEFEIEGSQNRNYTIAIMRDQEGGGNPRFILAKRDLSEGNNSRLACIGTQLQSYGQYTPQQESDERNAMKLGGGLEKDEGITDNLRTLTEISGKTNVKELDSIELSEINDDHRMQQIVEIVLKQEVEENLGKSSDNPPDYEEYISEKISTLARQLIAGRITFDEARTELGIGVRAEGGKTPGEGRLIN